MEIVKFELNISFKIFCIILFEVGLSVLFKKISKKNIDLFVVKKLLVLL